MSGAPDAIGPVRDRAPERDLFAIRATRSTRRAVRIEADVTNSFTRDTLQQYNTVADSRQRTSEQVVLLGAHLDSWTWRRAADNGTARSPCSRQRTQGGRRTQCTFASSCSAPRRRDCSAHRPTPCAREGRRQDAGGDRVDNGAGASRVWRCGVEELRDMWKSMLQPVSGLGQLVVRTGVKTGTDHLSFIQDGIPSFNYDQVTAGYNHTHHSQVDDYKHTIPTDVAQAATIMAVNAWQLADMKELLPRGGKR